MGRVPRGRAVAAALGLLGAVVLAGCSGSGDSEPAATAFSTLVRSSPGDRCLDPAGDLDIPAGVPAEARAALDGVDLTLGEAAVEGELLRVRFEVVGAVADALDPTFVVAQGDPLQPLSFELRLIRRAGAWQVVLITWPDGREQRRVVSTPVTASGRTVAVGVPLAMLPPIALSLQFGATAEISPTLVVIDDCSSLNPG